MKVAVVGSRGFKDYNALCSVLGEYEITEIISGGAEGADKLAEAYADSKHINKNIFLPDWKTFSKSAGYLRNQQMVLAADIVIAFWDGVSKGTKLTIDLCKKHNVELRVVQFEVVETGLAAQAKYKPEKNKLYLVDAEAMIEHAISNRPYLSNKDVVVIVSIDDFREASTYWGKKGIPCYKVRLVKQLCQVKRKAKDSGVISGVPEICLTPYSI